MSTESTFNPEIETYARFPIRADHGKGVFLYDESGKEYIDLYGGHCVTILGHSPESVTKAISDQASKLIFYSNVVHSTIREEAASLLSSLSPFPKSKVFYCNSGTEANENAIKIAWQVTGKHHIIAIKGSFHGRTLASISATDSAKMHKTLTSERPTVHFADANDFESISALFAEFPIGAVILEPIQSMNGMYVIPQESLIFLRDLCDSNNALLIFDEVQTGVGRTGTFSYSEGVGVYPDVITMAKSLASGIPIGALITPESIATHIKQGDLGTTFGGGMVAMAAHKATLEEIVSGDLMTHATELFAYASQRSEALNIKIHGKGCLIGLELPFDTKDIRAQLLEKGFITGSSNVASIMRLMPPINTPIEIFKQFFDTLEILLSNKSH
ncbi:aspartate aminotransferase family protein [bacterium]|nr:MAG: aspartate aminotransferase family protein [bacterium]